MLLRVMITTVIHSISAGFHTNRKYPSVRKKTHLETYFVSFMLLLFLRWVKRKCKTFLFHKTVVRQELKDSLKPDAVSVPLGVI